jgi:hypothetical protein
MRDESPVCQRDPRREHIEIGRDGEDGSHEPQMPRYARAVKERGDRGGRDDVSGGRGH